MLGSITRFGFLFLLMLSFFTILVKSASIFEKETSPPMILENDRQQEDRGEISSSAISNTSLSSVLPSLSSSSSSTAAAPKKSPKTSVESIQTPTTSSVKPLEPSSSIELTSTEPAKVSSLTKSQLMVDDIKTTPFSLTSIPATTPKSSSSHIFSSSRLISSATMTPTQTPQLDDDDLEDDTELIRTESIQEARLARKKQRATPRPTRGQEEKKAEFENALAAAHPHQNNQNKEQPVVQGPNDQSSTNDNNINREMRSDNGESDSESSATEKNNQNQDAPGLGKVGTALLSVGGVLMVAGITGGIFVWRAQQQHQNLPQYKSPTPSIMMSSPGNHHHHPPTALQLLDDGNTSAGKYQTPPSTPLSKAPQSQTMLDLNHQGPASASTDFGPSERHDLMNNWQNGLDFNYSMEKLFNNHTRPPHHPSARNSKASPAQGRMDETTQIDSPSINTSYRPFSASSSTQLPSATHNMSIGESSHLDRVFHDANDGDHPSHDDYPQGLHAASPISIYFPSSSPPRRSPPLLQQECKVNINLVHKDT